MKVAAITITLNDDYKFEEWYSHYSEYKSELYKHIIIDNGSEKAYLDKVKSKFSDSIIIDRGSNGGCTLAYNDGIKLALSDPDVDSILLIGNDIRLAPNSISTLYDYLYSSNDLGMVSPILLSKNSDIVECYGCRNSYFNEMIQLNKHNHISEVGETSKIVDYVPGGINLSKIDFYKTVGLQDENLFMYCDEYDMYRRSRLKQIKMGVIKSAIAWHQHINPNNSVVRSPAMAVLNLRNCIYVARKHDSNFKAMQIFIYYFAISTVNLSRSLFNKPKRRYFMSYFKGLYKGLFLDMNNDFIIK